MWKFCCLIVLAIMYYTQIRHPVLSLKISTLRWNVIAFEMHLKSYWLQCPCDWKKNSAHPARGCSFLDCCAVATVHSTHFKVRTATVKVDLCNVTSEGVTQSWFTKCSREQGHLNGYLPSFCYEVMISSCNLLTALTGAWILCSLSLLPVI